MCPITAEKRPISPIVFGSTKGRVSVLLNSKHTTLNLKVRMCKCLSVATMHALACLCDPRVLEFVSPCHVLASFSSSIHFLYMYIYVDGYLMVLVHVYITCNLGVVEVYCILKGFPLM